MTILALETSTPQGGVALKSDRLPTVESRVWQVERSHSELVTAEIEQLLKSSNLTLKDVDAFAVGRGPGSFTGIRVAINAVRTLAYVEKKPIYAFDTSEILAAGTHFAPNERLPLLTVINAQKNRVFASTFDWDPTLSEWVRKIPLQIFTPEDLDALLTTPHLYVGDPEGELESLYSDGFRAKLRRRPKVSNELFDESPRPDVLAEMAFRQAKTRPTLVWNDLQPLYIRASGAEESRGEKRSL